MAVEYVKEITGRDGSGDVDTNVKYRRTFLVHTTIPQDGASVVLAAAGIPAYNAAYSYVNDSDPAAPVTIADTNAVAVDIRAAQDNPNDPQDWRVTVDYAGVASPTAQPAEVEFSPTRYQKSLVVDAAGSPVVNSAGDPFETGITVDRTRFTLTLVQPVTSWDAVDALSYQDTLNADAFLTAQFPAVAGGHAAGFPAGTCKLTLSAKRMRQQGTANFYWLRTAVVDIDLNGWTVQVRDAGLNELIYTAGDVTGKRPISVGGVPVSSPQLLSDGVRLTPGSTPPAPLNFVGYVTKDWTPLGLGF